MAGLIILIIYIALYVGVCICLKKICEKCGKNPGILIWIPIVQLIPLLEVAGLPTWYIILFFVPIVSLVVSIYMWIKISERRGKGVLWGVLAALFLIGIPYLAFAD